MKEKVNLKVNDRFRNVSVKNKIMSPVKKSISKSIKNVPKKIIKNGQTIAVKLPSTNKIYNSRFMNGINMLRKKATMK